MKDQIQKKSYELILAKENDARQVDVTVMISLYNYKKYIKDCLDSVKQQTIENLNLVVVDDCSTDKSPKVVKKWLEVNGSRFNEYYFVRHKENFGLGQTRNTGISISRTKYIFILDADNIIYPRCVESLASALNNCEASFAYCYLEEFGAGYRLKNTTPWSAENLSTGNTIDAMIMIRKNVLEKVGNYSILPVMGWEDYDLWFKIARIGGWGVQVPEILCKYRVHKTSMLKTVTNPQSEKLWDYLKNTYPEFFKS